MRGFLVVASGVVFGLGLAVGGMLDPGRVVGFLDFFGTWDPTLALVMGAALAVTVPFHRFVRRLPRPLFDSRFHLPERVHIDRRLVLGSALFGVGWAIAGYCPGPALVTLGHGASYAVALVGAMALGSYLAGRTPPS